MTMQTNPEAKADRKDYAAFVITILAVSSLVAVFSLYQPARNLVTPTGTGPTPVVLREGLGTFKDYSQLEAFMAANARSAQQELQHGIWRGGPVFAMGLNAGMAMTTAMTMTQIATATSSTSASPASFTGTNVQVQGVDESDWVKTDGTHLFVATGNLVTIINAYPPSAAGTLSKIHLQPGGDVLGLEMSQNRLLVIDQVSSGAGSIDFLLYNTTNLSSPALMTNMSIAGSYVGSRMTQGYFYAIVQQPSFNFNNDGNATAVLPTVTLNRATVTLPANSTYYAPNKAQISYYTMIVSISMADGREGTVSVLTGPSSTIYVSTSNIYVVYTDYQNMYADSIPGDIYTGGMISSANVQDGQTSTVLRVAYVNGSIGAQAAGQVPGTVLNQFSMDEYKGDFRIATSRFASIANGTTTHSDDVYVLDRNMSLVSALQNIAPGENIYAVRFEGDMGYVVTFQQIDPLFAISFANPAKPVIVSALKVTGYSNYLQPLWNGYLLGVGKDTLQSSQGNFAWYLGLKLSLFHVLANGSSTQVAKYLIGDRGTESPVLSDHLAFTFDTSNNITVIPVTLALVSGNQTYSSDSPPPFGDTVWQGAYVFSMSPTGFTLLGKVSQYTNSENFGNSPNNDLQIERSVIIGNDLYSISHGEVMINDLTSFSTLGTIQLTG
jgi:inhibitor of cysteine peptidase